MASSGPLTFPTAPHGVSIVCCSPLSSVASNDTAFLSPLAGVRAHVPDPLILVVADHGESLDESLEARGYAYDHGEFLEAQEIQIPLVIAGPGVTPGRSSAVASIRDLYTTL